MPASMDIIARVIVPAQPQRVWDAAMDWRRQQEWMWGTRVRGGHGLGAEVVARTGVGPVGFTDTMVITEWDPPRRCAVRHTGRVVRGDGLLETVPLAQGCEFVWTERLQLPRGPAGMFARVVVRPLAHYGLRASLRRFARLVPTWPRDRGAA